jgi:hypothetical protein
MSATIVTPLHDTRMFVLLAPRIEFENNAHKPTVTCDTSELHLVSLLPHNSAV